MKELKKKIEAILFSTGKYMSIEEIAIVCKSDEQKIKECLIELTVDYENDDDSSLVILNEGDQWKLTTRQEYSKLIKKVVTQTEISKTLLETLAVIAYKYPIKQSDLIKIRTNKAYDHLSELEQLGFVTRQKYGRSRLIKLTDKFFEYFDLPRDKLKDRFKGFDQLAKTIEKKEEEIEIQINEQRKEAMKEKEQEEMERKLANGEIDLVDEEGKEHELEVYDEPQEKPEIKEEKEELGELEVVDSSEAEKKEMVEESTLDEIKEEEKVDDESDKSDDLLEEAKEESEQIEGKEIELEDDPKQEEEHHLKSVEEVLDGSKQNEEHSEESEPKDLLDAKIEKKDKEE